MVWGTLCLKLAEFEFSETEVGVVEIDSRGLINTFCFGKVEYLLTNNAL